MKTEKEICPSCDGYGEVTRWYGIDSDAAIPCKQCQGSGEIVIEDKKRREKQWLSVFAKRRGV